MPITLIDIRDDYAAFPDGAAVNIPGTVTVKVAWKVDPPVDPEKFGSHQGFIVAAQDGTEMVCGLQGSKGDPDFAPLQQGDVLEIFTTPSRKDKKPIGTKLESYVAKKDREAGSSKLTRKLKIYGLDHLRCLNRQLAPLGQAGPQLKQALAEGLGAPPRGQNPGPSAPHRGDGGGYPAQLQMPGDPAQRRTATAQATRPAAGKLTETEWHALYRRSFASLAEFFDPRMPSKGDVGAFIESAAVEILDLIHRGALSLCIAVQDGKVNPEPPPALARTSTQPTTPPRSSPPFDDSFPPYDEEIGF
jgi:hypothetical protein